MSLILENNLIALEVNSMALSEMSVFGQTNLVNVLVYHSITTSDERAGTACKTTKREKRSTIFEYIYFRCPFFSMVPQNQ